MLHTRYLESRHHLLFYTEKELLYWASHMCDTPAKQLEPVYKEIRAVVKEIYNPSPSSMLRQPWTREYDALVSTPTPEYKSFLEDRQVVNDVLGAFAFRRVRFLSDECVVYIGLYEGELLEREQGMSGLDIRQRSPEVFGEFGLKGLYPVTSNDTKIDVGHEYTLEVWQNKLRECIADKRKRVLINTSWATERTGHAYVSILDLQSCTLYSFNTGAENPIAAACVLKLLEDVVGQDIIVSRISECIPPIQAMRTCGTWVQYIMWLLYLNPDASREDILSFFSLLPIAARYRYLFVFVYYMYKTGQAVPYRTTYQYLFTTQDQRDLYSALY